MALLRDLLNWRSLRWKIALLVAVACSAVALSIGTLAHRSTLARSLNDGRGEAVRQLPQGLCACVTVRDHAAGFPRELVADGPRRFRTGASERGRGHGLGLTIALGQAEVVGASLSFANAPDGGALATLRLPAADRPD
ncbi:hypothetical protein GCM10009863_18220 [Streptomyces axinellae]|uniref:Histidine kinase/HSP90-like ATPase domain-containing protein n=1 Tax=Streptomyces axinellae TaxID=552788 RepID=A0ABP6C6P6_9ACTN